MLSDAVTAWFDGQKQVLAQRVTALPVGIALAMTVVALAGWSVISDDESVRLNVETAHASENLVTRIETHVATRLAIGLHIRQQWMSGYIENYEEFRAHANSAHNLFKDFQAINWIDTLGVIRWVTPIAGNEAAQGLNIRKLPVPRATMEEAERSGQLQVTPPIKLAQGGAGFVAYIPLLKNDVPDGFLNVVFRTEPLIREALKGDVVARYHLIITDGEQKIFESGDAVENHSHAVRRQIKIGNRSWKLIIMPNPAAREASSTILAEIVLVIGLVLALAAGGMVRIVMLRQLSLQESEARFKDFSESASDWFWEMDEGLRFSYFSERFFEISGTRANDMMGKMRQNSGLEKEDEKVKQNIADLIARREFKNFEHSRVRPDGSVVHMSTTGKPVFDKDGIFKGYRGTGTDITERKTATDAVRGALMEAEQANQAKSEFLATMSHEFRTPLNAILGFSEMLRAEYFGPLGSQKYSEYSSDIHSSGQHMLALVNDVLDIAAIEAGKRPFFREPIIVNEVLGDCLRSVEKAAGDEAIDLSLALPDGDIFFYADKRSITQIVQNLLSNAVKFTDKNGTVELSARTNDQVLTIIVKDSGVGIPYDKLPTITEPFSQTHDDPLRAQQGTGLGLSIVKSLVEAHDGTMHIESEVGRGTTVTLVFPLQQQPDQTA